jgi:hypothetical protein
MDTVLLNPLGTKEMCDISNRNTNLMSKFHAGISCTNEFLPEDAGHMFPEMLAIA